MKIYNSNLDHNYLLYDPEDSHTLLSHGGSGMTVHMMGMTYCTVHHKFQLCILGDNYISIEPRLMATLFLLYVILQTEHCYLLFWQVTPQKPGRQTHAPVSFKHVSLFRQRLKHVSLQWRPHRPTEHGSLQLGPWWDKGILKIDFFPPRYSNFNLTITSSNSEFNLSSLLKKGGSCSVNTQQAMLGQFYLENECWMLQKNLILW